MAIELLKSIAKVVENSVFEEALVDGHKLGDECLKVVNCLLTDLKPVLVGSGYLCDFGLHLSIAVRHQLLKQALKRRKLIEM